MGEKYLKLHTNPLKKLDKMNSLQTIIEQAWENRALLQEETTTTAIREVIEL
jgi:2,3,4,5-tetrahydropyridine-2-carboxylate N-succinyltransferase